MCRPGYGGIIVACLCLGTPEKVETGRLKQAPKKTSTVPQEEEETVDNHQDEDRKKCWGRRFTWQHYGLQGCKGRRISFKPLKPNLQV